MRGPAKPSCAVKVTDILEGARQRRSPFPCEFAQIGFLSFMTSEERTLISSLFDRLNSAAAEPKDPQADEYIRTKVSQQPSAPYPLVQSTLVLQQPPPAPQTRIADLEKQLAAAQRPGQEPSGSFLSGMANLLELGNHRDSLHADRKLRAAFLSICTLVLAFAFPSPDWSGAGWRQLSAECPLDSSGRGWWGPPLPGHPEFVGSQSRQFGGLVGPWAELSVATSRWSPRIRGRQQCLRDKSAALHGRSTGGPGRFASSLDPEADTSEPNPIRVRKSSLPQLTAAFLRRRRFDGLEGVRTRTTKRVLELCWTTRSQQAYKREPWISHPMAVHGPLIPFGS